jgi:predicted enzyme related to lactoylglutathione lyase
MDSVVHFEMPYEDRDRAAAFYQKTFGWKPQFMGPEMGDYVVVQTTETDDKGMIKTPGHINGGMFKRNSPDARPSVVIAVEDIKAATEKIRAGGGTVDDAMEIPGVGIYASFVDTEGNRLSILQPTRM